MLRNRCQVAVALVMVVVGMTAVSSAHAAPTEPFGPKLCLTGEGAAQCEFTRGIATSPINGHFYVADRRNSRINEFTAWGEFVKSWGWGIDDGSAELQTCNADTGCQKGLEGSGVGQFEAPTGVAVDSAGNIYVAEFFAFRVQKFSPDGEFLLMFGGDVNQGPNNPGDVCTAADVTAGDTCGAGTPGTGNGQFSSDWSFSSTLAIGPGDEVYVGDKGRVQEFDTDGNFVRVLPDPDGVLAGGKTVGSLAADPVSGDLYLAYVNQRESPLTPGANRPNVFRLAEDSGDLLDTLAVERPTALAVDAAGNVYVFDQLLFTGGSDPENHGTRILKFDSTGNLIETIAETPLFDASEYKESVGIAAGSSCFPPGSAGLYVAVRNGFGSTPEDLVQAYGPTPDPILCPPPELPPSINGQFASSVGPDSAALKAEINPHYFTPPIGTTTYYVQWGTVECVENEGFEGTCASKTPVPPASLDIPPVNEDVTSDEVVLEGLEENTAYRYRFVAEGSGAPGEPIVGVGGEVGVEGAFAEFTTLLDAGPDLLCPNDAFRGQAEGAGMLLRDCRAYELVSPVDKDGGDVQARLNIVPYDARADQASTSGDAITFSAYRAFQDPQSAPFSSQYLTTRTAGGWETEAISPPQEGEGFINPLYAIDNLYRYFSPDLSQGWLYTLTEPQLDPVGLEGEPNVYRRDNATDAYEACTTTPVLSDQTEIHTYQLQGVSTDGDTAAFRLEAKLTPNGSDAKKSGDRPINQAYVCEFDSAGNATVYLVSVLPDGVASNLENTIGGPANQLFNSSQGRAESLENAVSADGAKVFWTASVVDDAVAPGALYVRLNPAAEETDTTGACDEVGKACTQEVSAGPARFWKASEDGSFALFSEGGELNEYEVAADSTVPIAEEVVGVVGASEDLSRVYFLSEDEIVSGEGEAGEPNLYLYERGVGTSFVATLSDLDATQGNDLPSPANQEPVWHTSRVAPDGSTVAFMSNSPELAEEVADYDNTDQLTGTPAAEIYRYEIGGELACISCNRSGARPQGRQVQNKFGVNPTYVAASMLPTWLNALYAPRVLSDDGNRIYFEAFESLTPADTNGKADVYQWEAEGSGGGSYECDAADPAFDPRSSGCVSLISSGKSVNDSQFVDASPSGDDVFIRTASSLVDWDPGALDIYDARVEGGLSAPPPGPDPSKECKPEDCPGPPDLTPPTPPLPSAVTGPPGNVTEKPKKPRCPKGKRKVKVKGKVRCVKKKQGKKGGKNKAGKSGRASR